MSGYNVCDDLMAQIFERLPPKSINRFRSLSKYWHSRLVSPEFLHNYRLRCSKNPPKAIHRHLINHGNHETRDIYTLHSADQLPLGSGVVCIPGVEFPYARMTSLIGSSNGILCLYDNDKEIISLWNFSIRRKLSVPRHLPLKSWTYTELILGFGFDPITDDYNIVAICYNNYALEENRTLIYSLKTDLWSAIPPPPNRLSNTYVKPKACFYNGILHWAGHGYSTMREGLTPFILTFNLSSRVFGYIWLPEPWIIEQVTTINGCLAVVSPENNNFFIDAYSWIRVMKEYGNIESWSAVFKLRRDVFEGISVFQPVMNGDILAYYHNGSKVYNTPTKDTKVFEFVTGCYKVEIDTYVESLELLDKERATTCGKTVRLDQKG